MSELEEAIAGARRELEALRVNSEGEPELARLNQEIDELERRATELDARVVAFREEEARKLAALRR